MTILITGAAGFIGFHTAVALLENGEVVIGIDNLNDYYDVSLKHARLAQLEKYKSFTFRKADIAADLSDIKQELSHIEYIIHLAAQAGVRYSITHPESYIQSNLVGHFNMLELARHLPNLKHLVYASSSSVYGEGSTPPYSVSDRKGNPVSLYAATKMADEAMSHSYAHLYNIPMTGLRFFTVYGEWGRPDMAYYSFTEKIIAGEPITLFNNGNVSRDFTYISDIVDGIISAMQHPHKNAPHHKVYNLGNKTSIKIGYFVEILERAIGKKAVIEYAPMQMGDVEQTWADISDTERDLGYNPKVNIEEGLPRFVDWYKKYSSCQ